MEVFDAITDKYVAVCGVTALFLSSLAALITALKSRGK